MSAKFKGVPWWQTKKKLSFPHCNFSCARDTVAGKTVMGETEITVGLCVLALFPEKALFTAVTSRVACS